MSFGAALGTSVPLGNVASEYAEDVERVFAYGYRNVLRCPPGVGLTDLAVEAGEKAIAAAGITAADLDLVVLAVTDLTEYLYWDAAASLAHRLDATGAEAVLLTQACTSGVMSLDLLAGKFATHPRYETALVIAANRCCEAYWNRMVTQPLVFSDGAAAAVARRGHPRLRWLTTEVRTAGRYADFYRLDVGGATAPFDVVANTTGVALRARDSWDVAEFFDFDPELFEQFVALIDERTRLTVERACTRVDTAVEDLAKVILLHDNAGAMKSLAALLGVPLSRTNVDLALEHGHLGAADQLFCLGEYSARGELDPGSRVALVSRGRGMHWACTLLEV